MIESPLQIGEDTFHISYNFLVMVTKRSGNNSILVYMGSNKEGYLPKMLLKIRNHSDPNEFDKIFGKYMIML